jgi:hypothetical protein
VATYFEKNQETCVLDPKQPPLMDNATAMILIKFQWDHPDSGYPRLAVSTMGRNVDEIKMFSCSQKLVEEKMTDELLKVKHETDWPSNRTSDGVEKIIEKYPELKKCSGDVKESAVLVKRGKYYLFSVAFYMAEIENEGAYSVYYHNCPNYPGYQTITKTSFIVSNYTIKIRYYFQLNGRKNVCSTLKFLNRKIMPFLEYHPNVFDLIFATKM